MKALKDLIQRALEARGSELVDLTLQLVLLSNEIEENVERLKKRLREEARRKPGHLEGKRGHIDVSFPSPILQFHSSMTEEWKAKMAQDHKDLFVEKIKISPVPDLLTRVSSMPNEEKDEILRAVTLVDQTPRVSFRFKS